MSTLLKSFETTKTNLIKRRANRDAVANVLAHEKNNIAQQKVKAQELTDSVTLMQTFSNTLRSDIVQKFEGLLTKGAREVFKRDYKVSIEFQNTGNNVYADFFLTLPNGRKINLSKDGGGLKDFLGILQRILYIILEPAQPSRILFLDENLKAMDSDRSQIAFRFISDLAKELGIQLIFITHSKMAMALASSEGASVVEMYNDGEESTAKLVGG